MPAGETTASRLRLVSSSVLSCSINNFAAGLELFAGICLRESKKQFEGIYKPSQVTSERIPGRRQAMMVKGIELGGSCQSGTAASISILYEPPHQWKSRTVPNFIEYATVVAGRRWKRGRESKVAQHQFRKFILSCFIQTSFKDTTQVIPRLQKHVTKMYYRKQLPSTFCGKDLSVHLNKSPSWFK